MNPQSLNPYVYCMNNPMKYIDPNGESPWDYMALPDGAVASDEKRLEEYMREIESGDHNFDEETVGRIREWSHKAYEEMRRFWSDRLKNYKTYYEWGEYAYEKSVEKIVYNVEINYESYGPWLFPTRGKVTFYIYEKTEVYYHFYRVYEFNGKIIRKEYLGPRLYGVKDPRLRKLH